MPSVRLAMTPFPYSIEASETAESAWSTMLKHGIRHLPVTRAGELMALISERDLRLVLRPGVEPASALVEDACVEELYQVADDTPLDHVLVAMAERHLGSAVVTHHGKLAGILTVTDVCRHLAELLRAQFGAPSGGPSDTAA